MLIRLLNIMMFVLAMKCEHGKCIVLQSLQRFSHQKCHCYQNIDEKLNKDAYREESGMEKVVVDIQKQLDERCQYHQREMNIRCHTTACDVNFSLTE